MMSKRGGKKGTADHLLIIIFDLKLK